MGPPPGTNAAPTSHCDKMAFSRLAKRISQASDSSLPTPVARPRIEAIRIVDMSSSNSWTEFAALFRNTRSAFLDHERAKSELKNLIPEDAKEAVGYGLRAKRSKSGAISFELLETANASLQ